MRAETGCKLGHIKALRIYYEANNLPNFVILEVVVRRIVSAGPIWRLGGLDDISETSTYNYTLAKEIYGSNAPYPNNIKNLVTYATSGELLGFLGLRSLQTTPQVAVDPHGSPSNVPFVNETDLHSQALLVSLLWAQDNNDTNWTLIGTPLLQALFGSEGQSIVDALGPGMDPSVILTEIAYSALGTASPGGTDPFGVTAISSLFMAADTLGQFQDAGQFTGVMAGNAIASYSSIVAPVNALAEIAVQFAGDEAAYAGAHNGEDEPGADGTGAFQNSTSSVLSIEQRRHINPTILKCVHADFDVEQLLSHMLV